MQQLKSARINDMFARNSRIRPDGPMVHDLHLVQVKARGEVKDKWDYERNRPRRRSLSTVCHVKMPSRGQ